ncbi:hypothetical protein BR93DRAFT_935639 [Coniochaeta sp. PMI_546]|nr:hypothetical protein BR93DRAFT_935639 [Coniochaeta sp. PMI_546]
MGELDYNAEVTYLSPDSTEHANLDAAILAHVKEVTRAEMDCQRITTYFWADILEERRQAVLAEAISHQAGECDMPLFICTLAFPSMPTFLHIFEPRYRLMIRRALEGNRTFGMVLYDHPGFVEFGTVLRIVNVEFFDDGRSLLETIGVSRFRVLRHTSVDGYTVAKVEIINDISIAEEEALEAAEIQGALSTVSGTDNNSEQPPVTSTSRFPTTRQEIETTPTQILMDFAMDFVRRMQQQSVGWLTARILAIYGQCPSDPAIFPGWFGNILPVRETEKYRLLETTSVRQRLKICCGWILEWEASRCLFVTPGPIGHYVVAYTQLYGPAIGIPIGITALWLMRGVF